MQFYIYNISLHQNITFNQIELHLKRVLVITLRSTEVTEELYGYGRGYAGGRDFAHAQRIRHQKCIKVHF